MRYLALLITMLCVCTTQLLAQDAHMSPIKVGVSTALSGDSIAFGTDIKNALTLMNDLIGAGKYKLIFEDERCDNRAAVNVAQKLIAVDKVRYALGFPCNSTLLATAPIYSRAGVVVITSSATSGDVLDIGKGIFRLFPADGAGAELLLNFMAKRHRRVAILTEQNEYPVMMERSFRQANSKVAQPLEIVSDEFVHGQTDLKTTLLRMTSKNIEAIFINANTDNSFISAVKQLAALQFKGSRYAVYLPAAKVAKDTLGGLLEGFVFANLPLNESIVTAKGREVLEAFKKRFGEPNSGFPVVPLTLESFRVFDIALSSGRDPVEFLSATKFSGGLVPNFYFDQYGAVQGINFEMQRIDQGKAVTISQ